MLKVTENKGFHLELTNGAWISVQFGSMNYCQRRSFNAAFGSEKALDVVESIDAEITICNSHGYHITHHFVSGCGDQVAGYLSADQVAIIIGRLALMDKRDLDLLTDFSYSVD